MEEIVCPKCQRTGKVELNLLSNKLRCQCGEEFVPLEYVPVNDFREDEIDFDVHALRGRYYHAVGYRTDRKTFMVVRGSQFLRNSAQLTQRLTDFRELLIVDKQLRVLLNEKYYLAAQDIEFKCLEDALAVVSGGSSRTRGWEVLCGQAQENLGEISDDPIIDTQAVANSDEYASARPDFLGLDSEQLRSLIVTVLERRPNNSVKRDSLVAEVLKEINVRTSGSPRERFEKKLLREVHWLSDRNVVEEYREKNRRIKLSDDYRDLVKDRIRSVVVSKLPARVKKTSPDNGVIDPYTVKGLQQQNERLRKIVVLLSQEIGLDVRLGG